MTTITSFGDFLNIFAVVLVLERANVPPSGLGFIIAMKSLGLAVGGLAMPHFIRLWNLRTSMIIAQAASLVGATVLVVAYYSGNVSIPLFYLVSFVVAFFKQLFDGSRETQSKLTGGTPTTQRTFVAMFLGGHYFAQTVAPVVSYGLLTFVGPGVSLILDALTFLVTAVMAATLTRIPPPKTQMNVFRPLVYMWRSSELRDLWFVRAVANGVVWGVVNYLVFAIVADQYHLSSIATLFVYTTMGLGGFLSALLIAGRLKSLLQKRDPIGVCTGQLMIAMSMLLFIHASHAVIGGLATTVAGFGMGLAAVSSQHMRRLFTTADQLPEVIGLEVIVYFLVQFVVAAVSKSAIEMGRATSQEIFLGGILLFAMIAFFNLRFLGPVRRAES
jgi:hypothetical protein